jgi:hypothetical protein
MHSLNFWYYEFLKFIRVTAEVSHWTYNLIPLNPGRINHNQFLQDPF